MCKNIKNMCKNMCKSCPMCEEVGYIKTGEVTQDGRKIVEQYINGPQKRQINEPFGLPELQNINGYPQRQVQYEDLGYKDRY
jgi:hypothetical protein